jgi:hypothetical protein
MKIPYSYEIYKLNIQTGHIEIKYMPEDETLTAITYNVPIIFNEDGTQMELKENIDRFAPYREWAAQKFLIQNANTVLNLTGTITP